MATSTKSRTGRKVLDTKTGKVVDELKEDSVRIRVHDPNNLDRIKNPYRQISRNNLRLRVINRLLNCNAAYARDPFGMVLWPREWQLKMMPPSMAQPWCYDIVERDEPLPVDDAMDPRYEGHTVIKIANVPKECTEKDLRYWLLQGLLMDYDKINDANFQLSVLERKRDMLLDRLEAVGTMAVSGTTSEQVDTRQTITKVINTQHNELDKQIKKTQSNIKRWTRLLLSEPIELSFLKDGTEHRFIDSEVENEKEKYHWFADFKSLRGQELAFMAITKLDWSDLRLAATRPEPSVSLEEFDDPTKEINMRMVRVSRIKHGEGAYFTSEDLPTDDDFHFSSIDAMYTGKWIDGKKHDTNALEYSNYGIFQGNYVYNLRQGHGTMIYGRGDAWTGDFDVPRSKYTIHEQVESYPRPLVGVQFQIGVEHGSGVIKFADGAVYEGEMYDGRITGHGRYVSSTGVVEEGEFLDGMLHGEGYREEPNGCSEEGTFVHGVLEGYGTQTNQYNDTYKGYFREGAKYGRGVLECRDQNRLTAFWHNDMPSGRGDLVYRHAIPNSTETAIFQYEGSFSQGKVKGRHRHVDVEHRTIGHIPFTTYGKSTTHMAYPMALGKMLYKQNFRHFKNQIRRSQRETQYKDDMERANLKLYYALLDDFYEAWAMHIRELSHPDEEIELTPRTLELMREEKLRAKKGKRVLAQFPKYIQRIPLRLRDSIALGLLQHENAEEEAQQNRRRKAE
ncbi:hypothetical protein THRCLA_07822 [Thraustotheca clavata]|uniref:Phosphatidylinositol-4-phosphate 5-kinase n=1 Tax=Thraustotheca clavata TaxID=74557 RepID=A0A1V9ZBW3_9STRA|nr:hypothetical protein THRCLA_07822 [Thraustotheca clavata]